jgi:3-dehydroquinate synthetase
MVDSSIGGKVAVDHTAGKNLIGAFKFPLCVIADLGVLQTLPIEEFRAGMAEVIKHGILGDAELFRELEERDANNSAPEAGLVKRALQVKIEVVEQDPYEENIRAHLNLGHTFGQAIERLAGYEMRHGYAVAMGTATAARLAANLGYCTGETRDRILNGHRQENSARQAAIDFAARNWASGNCAGCCARGHSCGNTGIVLIGCEEHYEYSCAAWSQSQSAGAA